LIVDDEPHLLRALEMILSAEHDVTTYMDARLALDAIERGEPFDLILSDVNMPVLSGMDLYERAHRTQPAVAEAIVFMTAGLTTNTLREFVRRMPNLLLQKPPDLTALRMLIRRRMRGQ
jgi:DNA-binding NtrC family response regulator